MAWPLRQTFREACLDTKTLMYGLPSLHVCATLVGGPGMGRPIVATAESSARTTQGWQERQERTNPRLQC